MRDRPDDVTWHVVEQMLDGFALHEIICDEAGAPIDYRFLGINPAFEALTGLKRSELIGRTVREVIPEIEETWIERYGRVALTGEPAHFEDFAKDLDRVFEVRAYRAAPGHFACIFRDVTERRRMEEALRESEARLRTYVDSAPVGIFVVDGEGRYVDANPAACRMTGYTRDELCRRNIGDLAAPQTGSSPLFAQLRHAGRAEGERELRSRSGAPLIIHINAVALEGDRFLAFCQDVTESRKAAQERVALAEKLQHAQKLESLGVLAGGIAHDFNNLLVGVLGNTELALQQLPPEAEETREMLDDIYRAARRATDLAHQMLAYAGAEPIAFQPVDLAELVAEMASLARASVSRRATFHLNIAPGLPQVTGDAPRLSQVLLNLLTNASEALGAGGGTIELRLESRHCDRALLQGTLLDDELPAGDYVVLTVRDSGVGIPDAIRAQIFDPFFSTKFVGRGLGLSSVLGIVRAHRGTLDVESAPDEGTTFRVYLPVGKSAPLEHEALPASAPSRRGKGRVLVIDDEQVVLDVARRMLERLGFQVDPFSSSVEALEACRSGGAPYAFALVDLNMPDLDGLQCLERLRALRAELPVYLISGYAERQLHFAAGQPRPDGFIQKPFRWQDLFDKLPGLH